jgi:hypothetical protein
MTGTVRWSNLQVSVGVIPMPLRRSRNKLGVQAVPLMLSFKCAMPFEAAQACRGSARRVRLGRHEGSI